MIDIESVRHDTPGCESVIHFNNAGSSLSPAPVLDAQVGYLKLEATMGGYEAQTARDHDLDDIYAAAAEYLGCDGSEVAFTNNGSEAWWRAFLSVPLEPGDRVLMTPSEFTTGGLALIQARERGIQVEVIPDGPDGGVDVVAFEAALDERVKLVALTHLPMSNGLINPAAEIGRLTKSIGAFYLLDSCQGAGQLPLNVDSLGCDFLTVTGRKWLRGPRGSGLLYIRKSVLDHLSDPVFIDNRSAEWVTPDSYQLADDARRFEAGERSMAAKLGLGVALRYMLDLGIEDISDRVAHLATRLRGVLADVAGVIVHDVGKSQSGIVTFSVAGQSPAATVAELRSAGINTGLAGARNTRIMMSAGGLDAVVRAAPHYFSTEEEVDRFSGAVASLAG